MIEKNVSTYSKEKRFLKKNIVITSWKSSLLQKFEKKFKSHWNLKIRGRTSHSRFIKDINEKVSFSKVNIIGENGL